MSSSNDEDTELVTPPSLPAPEELSRVTVELYNSSPAPDIDMFDVPPRYFADVIESFDEPQYVRDAIHLFPELGSIKFIYNDGTVMRITWRAAGKRPLSFVFDGVPCRRTGDYRVVFGDEGAYLNRLFRGIHAQENGGDYSAVGGLPPNELVCIMKNPRIAKEVPIDIP